MGTCPKCEGALQPTWISGVLPNEVRAAEGAGVGSRGTRARVRRARGATRDKEGRREREKAKKEVLTPSGARADFGFTAHGMLPTAVPFDDDTTRGGRSPYGIAGTELGVPATGGGSSGGRRGGFGDGVSGGSASASSHDRSAASALPTPRQMVRVLDAHVVGQRPRSARWRLRCTTTTRA